MKTKLAVIFVLAMSLQACDSSSSSGSGSGPAGVAGTAAIQDAKDKCTNTPVQEGSDLRYVMSETTDGSSCTTGCQIFNSVGAYCQALQDDGLNNNCARAGRDKAYDELCR